MADAADDGTSELTDHAILATLRQCSEPVMAASDIADELGFTRQAVDRRLRALHDHGRVDRVDVGPSVGWYCRTLAIDQLRNEIDGTVVVDQEDRERPCDECGRLLGAGETVFALLQHRDGQIQPLWEPVLIRCDFNDPETFVPDSENIELLDRFTSGDMHAGRELRSGSTLVLAVGTLERRTLTFQKVGMTQEVLVLTDIYVREVLRNRRRAAGDEPRGDEWPPGSAE